MTEHAGAPGREVVETRVVGGFNVQFFADGSSAVAGKAYSSDGMGALERRFMVSANVIRRRHDAGLVSERQAASGRIFIEEAGGGLVAITDTPLDTFGTDLELAQNLLDVAADPGPEPIQPPSPEEILEELDRQIGQRAIGGYSDGMPMFVFKD